MGDECFYVEDGKKKDAAIHDKILAEGSSSKASSLRIARECGLTPSECAAIFGDVVNPRSPR